MHIKATLEGGDAMPDDTLRAWIARQINVRQRLERVCACNLLFLMVVTTKHTLEEAARFSGLHKSQFSNLLKNHHNIAVYTLETLRRIRRLRHRVALEQAVAQAGGVSPCDS
jgi:hypothetical protein